MTRNADRTRVAVVFGGRSVEHSISCLSAGNILAELDPARYEARPIGITRDGRWCRVGNPSASWMPQGGRLPEVSGTPECPTELLADSDVAFPVLHGRFGEDGTIQGMFEMLSIPYVGSGVLASSAAMDKPVAKRLMRDAGLPVGQFLDVAADRWNRTPDEVTADVEGLGWPVFVKPARSGSSIGIAKVEGAQGLPDAVAAGLSHDDRVIIECAVPSAREIEMGVLGSRGGDRPRVSVPAEIVVDPRHDFYDFEAKYVDGTSRVVIPAEVEVPVLDSMSEMARTVFRALGCAGLARVDFLLGRDGAPVVNEVNTMPGFTRNSAFPRMWERTGLGYAGLLDDLIDDALGRCASSGPLVRC